MAIPANVGITDIIHTPLQHWFSETALYGSLLPGRRASEQNETKQNLYQSKGGPSEAILLITLPSSTDKNLVLGSREKERKLTEKKRKQMKQCTGKEGVGLLHHRQMVKESWKSDACLWVEPLGWIMSCIKPYDLSE